MYLKNGLSFPVARKQALIDFLGKDQALELVLNEPNNILGIEYIKALKIKFLHRTNYYYKTRFWLS